MLKSSDWLDIAAGRPSTAGALDEVDLEIAVQHGLIGVIAHGASSTLRAQAKPVYARLESRQQVMRRHLRDLLIALSDVGVPYGPERGGASEVGFPGARDAHFH